MTIPWRSKHRNDPQRLANNPKTAIEKSFHRPFASHWGVLEGAFEGTGGSGKHLYFQKNKSKDPTQFFRERKMAKGQVIEVQELHALLSLLVLLLHQEH